MFNFARGVTVFISVVGERYTEEPVSPVLDILSCIARGQWGQLGKRALRNIGEFNFAAI